MKKDSTSVVLAVALLGMLFQFSPVAASVDQQGVDLGWSAASWTQAGPVEVEELSVSNFEPPVESPESRQQEYRAQMNPPDEIREHLSLDAEPAVERADVAPTAEELARTEAQVNSFDCSTVTGVPQTECEALVALYASTNGDGWTSKTNWLITTTPCDWYGIACDSGHVIKIDFYSNQLIGSIPPELGNLTSLRYLYLDSNQLTGGIPPELGNLTALLILFLQDNQLSGSIPLELGNLTALWYLALSSNQLTGSIPSELGNLTSLQTLALYNNQLSGSIPPALGNLAALWYLALYNNQLSGSIPAELGALTSLQTLVLGSNQLSGSIPPTLGNLTSLVYLDLSNNQLSGSIPPELGKLAFLWRLDLYSNKLSGSIPLSFTNLTQLDYFFFYNTYLCEPPMQEFYEWKITVLNWQGTNFLCSNCRYLPLIEK